MKVDTAKVLAGIRVHVIDVDQETGEEIYCTTCGLDECYDLTSHHSYDDAMCAALELKRSGRCRIGGGAAPLVLLLDAARHWVGYPPKPDAFKAQDCDHNEMIETDSASHAWTCAKCGYVYQ